MSKKVTKSSNRNEKLRMVLSNNLKDALDIERILSDLNIKMNIKTLYAIGCAGVIASCGNGKDGKGNEQEHLKNKLQIGNVDLSDEQIKLIKDAFGIKDGNELSQEDLNKYLAKYAEKQNKKLDDLKVEDLFDGNSLKKDVEGQLLEAKNTVDNEKENETEESIIGKDYDKLPEKIKEKLKKLDKNNEGFVEKFWNKIKNEANIDELIKNDKDLENKYKNFKQEKENSELIKNQLTRANFNSDDQTKITDYISFIDDTLKVKLNNNTAKQYLLNQLKEKEKQSEIVKCVESLYKQVISEGKIKTEIKKQLKTIIKTCFEKLISEDESYKRNIEIKNIDDITIEDNGKVKVKFTSKGVQKPQANEYIIEQEFFEIVGEELKYKEVKDNQENGEKSLSLMKLTYKNDKDLSNYQFEATDKTELDKLVTSSTPNTIKAKIETAITTAINAIDITDKFTNDVTKVSDRLNTLKGIIDDLLQGKITVSGNKGFIENLKDLDAIHTAMDDGGDKTKGKTAFETFIKTKFDAKRQEIYDFLTSTGETSFKAKIKTTLSGYQLLGKKGKITSGVTLIEEINSKLATKIKDYADSVKELGGTALNNSDSKLKFDTDANKTNINGVTLEIATAFETIKKGTKQFLGTATLSDVFGNPTTDNTIEKKLIDTLKTKLDGLNFADDGTKTKAKVIQEYMDSNFKDYNDLSRFVVTDLNNKLQDSAANSISDDANGLTDAKVTNVVNDVLNKVFGDATLCKNFFTALNTLAKVDVKSDKIDGSTALAMNASSLAKIQADDGKLASAGDADATQIGTVVKKLKDAVFNIYTNYNAWISTVNKQPCAEIKKLLDLIIADYKNDETFSTGNKLWVKLGNLLVKWMYVDSAKWSADETDQKTCFNASTKALASCFFNKVNKYTGVKNGVQAIAANQVKWNNVNNKKTDINLFGDDGIGGKNVKDDLLKKVSENIIWHDNLPVNFGDNITLYTIKTANQFTTGDIIVSTLANNKAQNLGSMYPLLAVGGYNNDDDFGVYSEHHSDGNARTAKINTVLTNVSKK